MHKQLTLTLSILTVILMTACTTPYQPRGATGGYFETPLGNDAFLVEFTGNGNTSQQQVQRFFMYRCADLAAQSGYAYFSIAPQYEPASPFYTPAIPAKPGAPQPNTPAPAVPAAPDALPLDLSIVAPDKQAHWWKPMLPELAAEQLEYTKYKAPIYIPTYTTTTVTIWTAKRRVQMYKNLSAIPRPIIGFVATEVKAELAPYIAKQTIPAPSLPRPVILARTGVTKLPALPNAQNPAKPS